MAWLPWRNARRFASKVLKQPGYAARLAWRRLRAYAAYHIADGLAPPPESITLFLTYRCNLRCKMCGQWGESGVTGKKPSSLLRRMLPFEVVETLLDDVARFKPSITLFGGEPLIHPRCVDIVRAVKARGMHCLMITNGSLLSRYADELVDAGLDELNVSLDGDRELHDEIRGMKGLFDRIAGGIAAVVEARRARGASRPLVNLQCTLSAFNYTRAGEMTKVAERLHADSLTFHNLIFLEADRLERQRRVDRLLGASSEDWEGFVFPPGIDPDVLHEVVSGVLKEKHPFSVDFYPNLSLEELRRYYSTDGGYRPRQYPARCLSPFLVAYVFPDGNVRPCLNVSYSFGDLHDMPFLHAWNSARAVEYRRFLKHCGIFPACVRCTELYRY